MAHPCLAREPAVCRSVGVSVWASVVEPTHTGDAGHTGHRSESLLLSEREVGVLPANLGLAGVGARQVAVTLRAVTNAELGLTWASGCIPRLQLCP